MDNVGIVHILSAGVSGFAFLLLLFAYSLASQVQQRILEVRPNEMKCENLELWAKMTERQLVNTRYFMACAFAFVIAGIFGLVYRAESQITLSFTPSESRLIPTVKKEAGVINIKDGAAAVRIKSDQTIVIENTPLLNEIQKLRVDLAAAQTGQRTLAEKTANLSPNAGFGSLEVKPR